MAGGWTDAPEQSSVRSAALRCIKGPFAAGKPEIPAYRSPASNASCCSNDTRATCPTEIDTADTMGADARHEEGRALTWEARLNAALRLSKETVNKAVAEAEHERQTAARKTQQTREAYAARALEIVRLCAQAEEALAGEIRSACTDAEQVRVAELDRVRAESAEATCRNEFLLEQIRTRAAEQARAVQAVRVEAEAKALATLEAAVSQVRSDADQVLAETVERVRTEVELARVGEVAQVREESREALRRQRSVSRPLACRSRSRPGVGRPSGPCHGGDRGRHPYRRTGAME